MVTIWKIMFSSWNIVLSTGDIELPVSVFCFRGNKKEVLLSKRSFYLLF